MYQKVIRKIFVCLVLAFVSCKATRFEQATVQGTFYKFNADRDFNSSYSLKLNSDSTFILNEKHFEANPQCKGKWKIEEGKFIILKCEATKDVTELLTNGYVNRRDYKLLIINKNKIRYNRDVILKRK